MIEQIGLQDRPGQPNDRMDLAAMTDLELQCAFQSLSTEIDELKLVGVLQTGTERLECEVALLVAMYRREAIQFEQVYRSMDKLERSLAASRERQGSLLSEEACYV